MQELIKAFILIFIAEMGDKTQILAMAFATRYPVKKVLMGIFLGSLCNHGLAVLLGSYVSNFIPINTIQIVAGFAFVGFALWTLKTEDEEEKEEGNKNKFGPVLTVALAFFIGELGDKTQLTAITLATDASYPLLILGGTVLGMIVTGGIGIVVGKKLGDKIPEFTIKIIAASVFMFFGVSKLYQTLPSRYLTLPNIIIFVGAITIIVLLLLKSLIEQRRQGKASALLRISKELYEYYHKVGRNIRRICLGEGTCGQCQGNQCLIGYTKTLIKNGLEDNKSPIINLPKTDTNGKQYDTEQVLESLEMTLEVLKKDPKNTNYNNIHEIRKRLEMLLFNRSIDQMNNWEEYKRNLRAIDRKNAERIINAVSQ
jgi:putative Ca2+/H+ antiporter (TMEM165/GDT1 family)